MASSFLEQKARAQAEKLERQYGSSAYGGTTWLKEQEKKRKKKKKEEDDIAPVRSTTDDDDGFDFFQKGAFEDGYQAGDIAKAILGTAGDVGLGALKGASKLVGGVIDAGAYGIAGIADAAGNDKFADKLRVMARENVIDEAFEGTDSYLDQYSLLGRTGDAISEGLGQVGAIILTGGLAGAAGAGVMGATAATTGMMGVSSFGSGVGEAYEGGATDEEAAMYGLVSGVVNAGSELIFGGLGKTVKALGISKGLSSLDDVFAQKLASKITNQTAKNFVEFGVKASAEGVEEVLAGIGEAVGKKLTYMEEKELRDLVADENLLEQFVVGAVTSGISQSGIVPGMRNGSLIETTKKGQDFISGMTESDQKVVERLVENHISEQEKDGKKLSKKEKNEVYDDIIESLERGEISLDTIAEVIDGEGYKAYQDMVGKEEQTMKELAELYEGDALQKELSDFMEHAESKKARAELDEKVFGLVKNGKLAESYYERGRRGQAYQADLSKYDEKQRAVIERAVNSGVLNNTRRTHEFVDMIAKISADKGVLFDFTSNEKLKGSIYAVEGKTVNGFVTKDGITLNLNSAKALNSVVGHEITHVLEGTELYTELQSVLEAYAKGRKASSDSFANEYLERYHDARELYKGIEGYQGIQGEERIKREVIADLVGDYLFTDTDFVNHLVKNRNVFMKLWDEVKYLYSVSKAGSEEARQLLEVKRAFEKAYRSNGKNADFADEQMVSPVSEHDYTVIENLLDMKRVNNTTANEIIRDEALANAFTKVTGVALEGTTEQKRSLIRQTVRNHQLQAAEDATKAKMMADTLEMAKAEAREAMDAAVKQANAEQAIRDGGYRSYIRGIFQKGATKADALEILRNPEMKAEWESVTGKKLPTNQKSAIKMIVQTERNPAKIELPDIDAKYSVSVTDKNTIDFLENQEHITTYKAMQVIDGKLYPPMAAKVKDENGKYQLTNPSELGKWQQATEDPTNIKKMKNGVGYYTLNKGDGTSIEAAYNPYEHSSNLVLNDQFESAHRRDNLVVVECEIPVSEMSSGYKAQYAKDGTGVMDWKSGVVAGKIKDNKRQVYLSRYLKPVRILSDAEVAGKYKEILDGTGVSVPFNVVQPSLLAELEKAGVDIDYEGSPMYKANQKRKAEKEAAKYSVSDSDGKQLTKEQADYFKDSKVRDENGNLKVMYHGSWDAGFHIFDPGFSDDSTSLFFVDRNGVARSYSGTNEIYEAKTINTVEDLERFFDEIGAEGYEVIEEHGRLALYHDGDLVVETDDARGIYEEFCDYEGVGHGEANYKVYLNLKNPLVVDAKGKHWNGLPNVNKDSEQYEYIKIVEVYGEDGTTKIEYAMKGDSAPVFETVDLYQKFPEELATRLSDMEPGEILHGEYSTPSNTRDYALYAKEHGYDGVIFNNIVDIGGYGADSANPATVAIAFESNQIKSVANEKPTGDRDIRYSLAENGVGEYLDTKNIQYSLSAVPTHRKSLEKNYSNENASMGLPVIMERYDKILDIWERLGGELNSKFLEDWNNKSERPFTIFKAQAGYKYNVELSSMCKKGVPLFEAIDAIVKQEVMKELDTDVLGKEEKEILYDILKQHHFEIPCAICYVEQARQREGVIIDAFLNGKTDTNSKGDVTGVKLGWNQVLDSIQKEMKANGVDHNFAYVSRDIATDKYDPADLSMDEQTYAAFAEAVKKVANQEITRYNRESGKNRKLLKDVTPEAVKECFKGTLPSNLKIFKVLLTEPSSRFKIQDDLLYSSMTTKNLTMAHNGLYSLFNSQGGVSGYKTKQAPTVYWGEILNKKWKPEDTRKEGGVRNQSNSDFQMFTLLDQAQMYMDFSAKGYYLQAYTKVLSELKLFGLSKSKINASLIPNVVVYRNADGTVDVERTMENAGLDENGNPVYDDIEGINHKEAFMLLEDPEYSKNIGGICIGYSDNHIRKLLDDDRVQLIIGFHDKTNDPDKRYRGARYAKNYNGLNEAVKTNADGKTETVHIGFNPYVKKAEQKFKYNKDTEAFEGTVNHNGKTYTADDIPRLAADLYLEMCAKKGYTPAYNDFSGHRNYYKLLADFSLYDSQGHYAPHRKVAYDMPDSVPYLDADGNKQYMPTEKYIKIELQKELAVRDAIAEAMADTSEDGIIPQFKAEVNRRKVAPLRSLSEQGAEHPVYGDYNVYGEDIALAPTAEDSSTVAENATVSETESVAPVGISETETTTPAEEIAPVRESPVPPQPPVQEETGRQTRKELHHGIVERIRSAFQSKGYDLDAVLKKAKNLSTFSTVDNIPQRVMEKALGYKEGQILSDITVNQVAQNETEGIKWLNKQVDTIRQLSKQYGIKPGSKESAAAQMYAEGFYVGNQNDIIEYGDAELAQDFPDPNVRANIKALAGDTRIRQMYDDTLAMINESRARNLYPEIQKLDNYFLHFRAMDDTFSRLGLPFNPNDIRAKDLPTDLNGVTADLKPGQPFFASAMHRTGKRTSFDLLGGLERYMNSAKNQIYHIDDIQTLRALRNYIADTYGQANGLEGLDLLSEEEAQDRINQVFNSHLSTFAKFLNEEANILAGKTALIDRGLEGIIGRRGITFLNELNKQVGSNMVGYNVSSSLTNFLPVVQTFAKGNKTAFVKAFAQTVASKVSGRTDSFLENSPVVIRRRGSDRFYRTAWQKMADPGYAMMSMVDNISTELIARTKYNELVSKGMDSQKAHYETDKWVSRLMGDRSLGQMPQLYNSRMLGLVTKFQLEVRNQLDSQFYDTIQEAKVSNEHIQNEQARNARTAAKVTSTFVQLAVAQHLFGMAFESVAGYNPAFDIIEVLMTAFGFDDEEDSEDTALDNLTQGLMALAEDLPYASTFLDGGRIPISAALPIEELVKGQDEWGNEKSRWDTLKEVAPYYLLPGGYGQIKKTVQGLGMFSGDHPVAGSYTDSGNLRFPMEDTVGNRIKAGVFGQWANENARDYFDNERSPLKEKQIQEFIDVEMPIRDYWEYREGLNKQDTLEDKFDYIADLDLPVEKKNILINNIVDRKEAVDMTGYEDFSNYEEFDFAAKNPEKYDYLQANGISYAEYNASEESKEAYNWAFKNPEKATLAKAVCNDVVQYRRYTGELYDIKADKDSNGDSIRGSRKEKVLDWINGLDADYGTKIILFKSEYEADDTYNQDIVNYLNGRDDITYEERVTIFKELGFTVSNGTVYWD